jgi:hypothetical protein
MGQIISSACDYIPHCESAAMGEAIACLQGLNLSLANSFAKMVIETDYTIVLEAFKEDSNDRSAISLIAREFRLKKPSNHHVILTKISRGCNSVAHDLCQIGRRVMSGGVLQGVIPTRNIDLWGCSC